MRGSESPRVISVLMAVGVCGRALQGEGPSAQGWVGCLLLASRGKMGPNRDPIINNQGPFKHGLG